MRSFGRLGILESRRRTINILSRPYLFREEVCDSRDEGNQYHDPGLVTASLLLEAKRCRFSKSTRPSHLGTCY